MTVQKDPERNESRILHQFGDFGNKRVMEIGCGEGRLTWQYAKETRVTVGIDLDANALRVATFDRPSDLETKVLPIPYEPSIRRRLCDCLIRSFVVCQSDGKILHPARFANFTRRTDVDPPAIQEGTHVDQDTVWHKDPTDLAQGMDHAFMFDASERPRQQRNIELLF